MDKRKICITGATGFVGPYVVAQLLADGHELRLLVRDRSACDPGWIDNPLIEILQQELQPGSALEGAVSGCETVVHLAGLARADGIGAQAEAAYQAANVETIAALTDAAVTASISSFINVSSIWAVTANAASFIVDDSLTPQPNTGYGCSKLAAENHVAAFARTGRFGISLRPPLVIGAGSSGSWATLQALAATGLPLPFGAIRSRRSMVSAQTLASAIAHLCSTARKQQASGAYALCDPGPVTIPELLQWLGEGMGKPARLLPFPDSALRLLARLAGKSQAVDGLLGDLLINPGRFMETFDFAPSTLLNEAVRQSGAAYMKAAKR